MSAPGAHHHHHHHGHHHGHNHHHHDAAGASSSAQNKEYFKCVRSTVYPCQDTDGFRSPPLLSERNPKTNNPTPLSSKEAASYDSKHEKTLNKLIEEIRERVDFIGADWVDDGDDSDQVEEKKSGGQQTKTVRLLDYACGTGVGMFFPFVRF